MRRAYVFRLRPTARQHVALAACVDSHRERYNAALQERRDAWTHSTTRVYYGDQSAQLTEIRNLRADQALRSGCFLFQRPRLASGGRTYWDCLLLAPASGCSRPRAEATESSWTSSPTELHLYGRHHSSFTSRIRAMRGV